MSTTSSQSSALADVASLIDHLIAKKEQETTMPARKTTVEVTAAPASDKVVGFRRWKSSIDTARSAVDYSGSSPIFGMTDIEVLVEVNRLVKQTTALSDNPSVGDFKTAKAACDKAEVLVTELLKRKTARVLAGQEYRNGQKQAKAAQQTPQTPANS